MPITCDLDQFRDNDIEQQYSLEKPRYIHLAREAKPPPGGWPDLSGVPTNDPELEAIFESMRSKRPPGYPKTGKEVWKKLNNVLKPRMVDYYSILGNAHNLFGEAAQAFDARAIEGASLIIRATMEAACYLFLTTKPTKKGIREVFPLTLDGKVRQVQFEELIRAIIKTKILSSKQERAIRRIQKNGNLIAHLASHHATQIRAFQKEAKRVNKEVLSKKGLTDEERMRIEMKVRSILRFWLTQEEVLDDLNDAASILKTLSRHVRYPTVSNVKT